MPTDTFCSSGAQVSAAREGDWRPPDGWSRRSIVFRRAAKSQSRRRWPFRRARGHRLVTENQDFSVTYRLSSGYEVDPWRQDVTGQQGRLAIEFVDASTGSLFWRGTARAVIKESDSIEVRQKRLTDAVNTILGKMPSKAGG